MSPISQKTSDISFFFEPRSVAVVGATNNPLKFGHYVMLNLIDLGFKGDVYPVNLKAEEVLGLKAYPRVDLIPDEVEVVAILDNDPKKQGKKLGDIIIQDPDKIDKFSMDAIIIASRGYKEEIFNQMKCVEDKGVLIIKE